MYHERTTEFRCGRRRMSLALLFIGIMLSCVVLCSVRTVTRAENSTEDTTGKFDIGAEVLDSDKDSYTVQVTIQNNGEDWDGTVRLRPIGMYYSTETAYDTEISLPQGSRKQFTMRVGRSQDNYNSSRGAGETLKIIMMDPKGKKAAVRQFDQFLTTEAEYLNMGILSDNYSALTYLDMGGDQVSVGGDMYPIKLHKLEQKDILDDLEKMDFLVVDQYNTSSLSQEDIAAITDWNYDGGILIVGTGTYAENVLSGLGDYLEIKCNSVYEIETEPEMTGFAVADLQDVHNRYYENYYDNMSMSTSQGDGAIVVLPLALTDLGKTDFTYYQYGFDDPENYVRRLLTEAYNYASVRYQTVDYADNNRTAARMMRYWGNNNNSLNFSLLKVIVFLYVIFVGPVLYLILKAAKKKELYWVFVPVSTLCALVLIFLAGRGFKMVNTSVFSVTLENAEGRGQTTSYLYCYDADHKEWDMKLADGYDFAGGYSDNYSYRYYDQDDDSSYYYHVRRKGDALYVGIRPSSSFEDCFFLAQGASKRDPAAGSIECQNVLQSAVISYMGGGLYGQITNNTGEDFDFYAVLADHSVHLYGELRAGETVDLGTANPIYHDSQNYSLTNQFLYGCLDDDYKHWDDRQIGQLSAIGTAIAAFDTDQYANKVVVIGVTRSGEKVVDDRCDETAYRCLYVTQ
ncbi:MAG: hypothetical protein J6M66_00715 [Lachnospiraceae bacterium]|nr:hypothetical protein [Lachnospiraceae bacterium]